MVRELCSGEFLLRRGTALVVAVRPTGVARIGAVTDAVAAAMVLVVAIGVHELMPSLKYFFHHRYAG